MKSQVVYAVWCNKICLVRLQGKFEIDHSWGWKGKGLNAEEFSQLHTWPCNLVCQSRFTGNGKAAWWFGSTYQSHSSMPRSIQNETDQNFDTVIMFIRNGSCKKSVCTDFITIFQVAQNPPKLGVPTLLIWKKRPRTLTYSTFKSTPPPPLPPPPLEMEREREGGGGGGRWIKHTGTFFTQRNWHGKFQRILSHLKNRDEIGIYAFLARTPSIHLLIQSPLSHTIWQLCCECSASELGFYYFFQSDTHLHSVMCNGQQLGPPEEVPEPSAASQVNKRPREACPGNHRVPGKLWWTNAQVKMFVSQSIYPSTNQSVNYPTNHSINRSVSFSSNNTFCFWFLLFLLFTHAIFHAISMRFCVQNLPQCQNSNSVLAEQILITWSVINLPTTYRPVERVNTITLRDSKKQMKAMFAQ